MTRALAIMLVVLGVGAPAVGHADPFDLNDSSWQGCTEFLELARRELGDDRVLVRATLDWEALSSSDGLLLLHPTQEVDAEEATEFMKEGGRLAAVDDFGEADELLAHFRIHRRTLPTQPLRYLRNNPALPVAEPARDTEQGEVLGLHPTVAQVQTVVLNHGSGLRHPDLTPVLDVRGVGTEPVAVAVAGQVGDGRLFAVGDASVFINQMLRYPGNRAFAAGLVRYLADGEESRPRHGRLYILANTFDQRGSYGGVTPLRKTVDRRLAALMQGLRDVRNDGFPWWLHIFAAALTAVLILWWVMRVMVRMYQSRVPRFARGVPLVAQGGVPGRLAVLSSPASPPALAMLEMRSALTEVLAMRLAAAPSERSEVLVDRAERAGLLEPKLVVQLRAALRVMQRAEEAIVTGVATRFRRAEILRVGATMRQLYDRLDLRP